MSRYQLKLTALSPIHIGTAGGEIGPTEFFAKNDHAYITSEKYVVEALSRHGLVDNFVDFFLQNQRPTLGKYLSNLSRKQGADIENDIIIRKVPLKGLNEKDLINRPKLRTYVSSGIEGLPYLPGSSIKGALRNALLYLLCQENEDILKKVVNKLPEAKPFQKQWFAREIDQEILQDVNLPNVKQGPNTDWLKGLVVSDAYPEESDCTQVVSVKVVSLTEDGCHFSARGNKDIEVNVEAVTPGTTFICDVIVDEFTENMLTRFNNGYKKVDFEELLTKLEDKFAALRNIDKNFFNKAGITTMDTRFDMLEKWGANFRLGWGSGLLTMTVDLLLSEKSRRDIRQAFYTKRNNPDFPQSRKVVVDNKNSIIDTLGWINLKWERIDNPTTN